MIKLCYQFIIRLVFYKLYQIYMKMKQRIKILDVYFNIYNLGVSVFGV